VAIATVTAADLRIVLTGAEFEPTGPAWDRATEAERRAYWRRLAEIAYFVKRQEIARGIGADGKKLPPVKPSSRPDGAKGQPLDPHYGESRTARLLAFSATATGATLYWRASGRKSWAVILGYHARIGGEVRGAPLRDTLGISPRGRKQVAVQARQWWATGRGTGARTAAEAARQAAAARAQAEAATQRDAQAEAKARREEKARAKAEAEARRAAEKRQQRVAAAAREREAHLSPEAVALRRAVADLPRDEAAGVVRAWIAGRAVAPTPYRAHGMADAEPMHTLEWEGQTFRYADDARMVDRIVFELTSTGWRPMPMALKRATREIVFTTQTNEDDEKWKVRYNDQSHVSGATGGDGRIVVYRGAGLYGSTESHESGHNLAAHLWGSTHPPESSEYGRVIDSDEPPVSDYARNSRSEDFAEAVRLYVMERDYLARIAPRRHAVLGAMLGPPGNG
jgi:hypothetical protein